MKRNKQAKQRIKEKIFTMWAYYYRDRFNKCLEIDDFAGASVLWHEACEKVLLFTFNVLEGQPLVDKPPR